MQSTQSTQDVQKAVLHGVMQSEQSEQSKQIKHNILKMKARSIRYNGIDSVKVMLKEMPGLRIMLDSKKGECFLMSDGFKETRMFVKDGDYVVMLPKEENNLKSDAFFVFNPAVLFGIIEEKKEEEPEVKEVKKVRKKKSPLVQMMEEAAEEISSPEYQDAARALARAQAELNSPTL